VYRYGAQGIIGLHVAASDMRVPQTAVDLGGHTGIEAHSDGIGPDHRTGNNAYGYRGTIRCRARTEATTPDWVKRGTGAFANGGIVARDAICLPKDAVLTENYTGTYFVCTTAGTLGGTDTVLDAATVPLTEVTDGTAVWECRVGTEVGIGLFIANGSDNADSAQGYYRYGIIIDNGSYQNNASQIAHAIYVNNDGMYNFESYGNPTWHGHFYGKTAPADLALGLEAAGTGTTLGTLTFRGDSTTGAEKTFGQIVGASKVVTNGSEQGRVVVQATVAGIGEAHAFFEDMNTVIGEKAILNTTATAGFLHIGRCAGAPSGVPDLYTGKCPMVVDSTNGRLYVYHTGAWHYATLT
jgi:hypothetical protein